MKHVRFLLAPILCCLLGNQSAAADDKGLATSLNNALQNRMTERVEETITIDGCQIQRTITNSFGCPYPNATTRESCRTEVIFLDEISEIRTRGSLQRFSINFNVDYERPSRFWILRDRIANGKEGRLERYMEARENAFNLASTKTGQVSHSCFGEPPKHNRLEYVSLSFAERPAELDRLIQLAQQCRSELPLTITRND